MSAEANPYRSFAGYQRALHAVLDSVNARHGRIPATVRVEGLTPEELRELRLAFWRKHVEDLGEGQARLHVRRIIRDLYDGNDEVALDTWFQNTGRKLENRDAEWERTRDTLLATFQEDRSTAAEELRELLNEAKGWPTRCLMEDGPAAAADLVTAFLRIVHALPVASPMSLRTFSSEHLRNSKALDPGTRMYRLLADFLSDDDNFDVDPTERRRAALEGVNLVENFAASLVSLAGPIGLRQGSATDFVAANYAEGRSCILTLEQVRAYDFNLSEVRALITVENEVPFQALVGAHLPQLMIVCTRGQPSIATRELLQRVGSNGVPSFHWGDIDPGGFRILQTMQRAAPLQPLLMDEDTVRRYSARLSPFTDRKEQLTTRAAKAGSGSIALQACLDAGGWLEQEAIPLDDVLEALQAALVATRANLA